MFVKNFMTQPVVTVTPDILLPRVKEILSQGKFRHLPVVDKGRRLVGIVTDRDLRSAYPSALMDQEERQSFLNRFSILKVNEIMTEAVFKLAAAATLDDALIIFDRSKVGALPVVDKDGRVVGMLSVRDLLTAYRQLFGLGEKGSSLITVADDGTPGTLVRLTGVLEERKVPFTRLIRTSAADRQAGSASIYVRIHTYNLSGVHAALEAAGFRIVMPQATEDQPSGGGQL